MTYIFLPSGGGTNNNVSSYWYWWAGEPCVEPQPGAPVSEFCDANAPSSWQPLTVAAMAAAVGNTKGLDNEEINWLSLQLIVADKLWDYLYVSNASSSLSATEKNEIANCHFDKLRSDPTYYNFDQKYRSDQPNRTTVWWEDSNWLSDPDKFNLDVGGGTEAVEFTP